MLPPITTGIPSRDHIPNLQFVVAAVWPVLYIHPPQGPGCVGWGLAVVWASLKAQLVQRPEASVEFLGLRRQGC